MSTCPRSADNCVTILIQLGYQNIVSDPTESDDDRDDIEESEELPDDESVDDIDPDDIVDDPCLECGGKCCSFRTGRICHTSIDDGKRYDSHMLEIDIKSLLQLVRLDGGMVDMDWYIAENEDGVRGLYFDCNHLTDDGKCDIYEDRPHLCRAFECPVLRGEQYLEDWLDEFDRSREGVRSVDDLKNLREVTDRIYEIALRRISEEIDEMVLVDGMRKYSIEYDPENDEEIIVSDETTDVENQSEASSD